MAVGLSIAAGTAIAGYAASNSASKRAAKTAAAAQAQAHAQFLIMMGRMDEAVAVLEEVGIPSIEAQRVVLQTPDAIPQLISEMTGVEIDPRLVEEQMSVIAALDERVQTGETSAEEAQRILDTRRVAAQRQAQQKSILQNMAQRGMSGSGVELAARLGSNADANAARELAALQSQGQRQERAMQALQAKGAAAQSLASQKFQAEAQRANALDAAQKFNLNNQWQHNLTASQIANQENLHNKGLIQQNYQNELAKAQAVANAKVGQGQAAGQYGQNIAQMGAQQAAGQLAQGQAQAQLFGQLGAAGISALGQSGGKDTYNFYDDGGTVSDDWLMELLGEFRDEDIDPRLASGMMPECILLEGTPVGSNRYTKSAEDGSLFGDADYAGGGIPVPGNPIQDDLISGDVVPGNSFEGDRVDAKINSGEMVLNLPQQQRLMELLKGYRSLAELGDENIVQSPEGAGPDVPVPGGIPGGDPSLGLPEEALAGAVGPVPPGADGLPSLGDEGLPPGLPARDGRTIYAEDGYSGLPKYNQGDPSDVVEWQRKRELERRLKEAKEKSWLDKLKEEASRQMGTVGFRAQSAREEGGVIGTPEYTPHFNEGGFPRGENYIEAKFDALDAFNDDNKDEGREWLRGLKAKQYSLEKEEERSKEKSKENNAYIKAIKTLAGEDNKDKLKPLSDR